MRHVAALSRCSHSLASFALFHSSSFRLRLLLRLQRLPLHTFIRGLPRYARPPLLKAVSFSRRPFAPLPRLRTLRSTSRLSALRTSSRGHGLADVGLRSRLRHRSTRHSFDASLPSPRTFKRTLERLDVAPHARQNRQARHKRIKPPFPPPRGIPLSHALAGWSAGRLPPLQVQQCVSIRSWGKGLDA